MEGCPKPSIAILKSPHLHYGAHAAVGEQNGRGKQGLQGLEVFNSGGPGPSQVQGVSRLKALIWAPDSLWGSREVLGLPDGSHQKAERVPESPLSGPRPPERYPDSPKKTKMT